MITKVGLALGMIATLVAMSGATTLTCDGSNWVNRLTRCYFFSTTPADSWYSAMEACDNMGGHPLSIESAAERDNVVGYIKSSGYSGISWWTSASNNIIGGNWVFYGTGRLISSYNDYCSGSADGSVQHCLVLNPDCDYAWTVADCNANNFYYICEKDISKV